MGRYKAMVKNWLIGLLLLPMVSVSAIAGWSDADMKAAKLDCKTRLQGLDIVNTPPQSIGQKSGCGAPAPVVVSEVAGVSISPPAELTCDMAEALHGWVASSLVPASKIHLKKKLVTINNASAYVCRRRNNSKTGKLSEHAKANALDVATLGFEDGSKISIKGDWSGLKHLIGLSAQGQFLRHIRRDACIRFTTVLGPGSDAHHGDHFHIDVARRKNGYRLCQ
jgi:hypothetical protein